MNASQSHYAEPRKPDTKEDKLCNSTGMKFIYSNRKQMSVCLELKWKDNEAGRSSPRCRNPLCLDHGGDYTAKLLSKHVY